MHRLGRSLLTWKGTPWIGGSLILVLGALTLLLFTGSPSLKATTVSQDYATDITYGLAGARVVLVEYADFQCEACARAAPMLASLRAEYGDRVLFVYRFFPLDNHQYGMVSAQAAYAAFLQGKFWDMHDLLYKNQQEWSDTTDPLPFFDAYATSLGLDMARFREDLNAQSTKDLIAAQQAEGSAAGVNHTPWYVLNGSVFVPYDRGDFTGLLDAALAL